MTFLDTFLGVGYAGYARLNGVFLGLLPSSTDEQDNLYRSTGTVSTLVAAATGQVPVRQRRQLTCRLTADLTPATLGLVHALTFDWRNFGATVGVVNFEVVFANGQGYQGPEGYVEEVTVQVPESGSCTVNFDVRAWRWTDTPGGTTPSTQTAVNLFGDPQYQPYPHWDTKIEHSGHPGIARHFTWGLKNAWQFRFLMEGTLTPPTPRVAFVAPLGVALSLTTVALPNQPPGESGSAILTFGGHRDGASVTPQTRFLLPALYRDPGRHIEGYGDQDHLLEWSADWVALGGAPQIL
jgi:hypothetical protein